MSAALDVIVTAFTHQGAVRPHNEDTIAVGDWLRNLPMEAPRQIVRRLDRPLLCLVADGLGGHAAGEVASLLAAQCLSEAAAEIEGETDLAAALEAASRAIFEAMAEDRQRLGMGSTVVCLLLRPDSGLWANVGDSRLYQLDGGTLVQLSQDDVPDPGAGRRRSHLVTQCLGGGWSLQEIEPHTGRVTPAPGRRWLLCSDGVTDMLDDAAIAAALGDDDLASVDTLFGAAMAAGGADNVSLLLVRVAPRAPA
jgi:serine/threonine protein phosphatase PrpC